MSIEAGGVGAASNPSTAKGAKSRSATDDGVGGTGAASFVAVLATTMEPAALAAPEAAAAPADDTAPNAAPPSAPPDPAAAHSQHRAGQADIADHAALAAAQPELGNPVWSGATLAADGQLAMADVSDAPGMATTDRRSDARSPGSKPSGPRPGLGVPADAGQSRPDDAAPLRAAHASSRAAETGANVLEAGDLSATRSAAPRGTDLRRAAEAASAELRGGGATPTGGAAATGLSLVEGAALVKEAVSPRAAERSVFRPFLATAAAGATGSWTEHALNGGGTTGVTSYSPEVGAAAPALSVAQRVYYWISRGVQNAELRLDAFGGGSVEVSISVQGSAAQVEFRSDQPEARKVLHDAMPHLKDLLKEEGLSLSGGFVGTSAQQQRNAPEQRAYPQNGKVSTVRFEPVSSGATTGPGRTPGRAVDVFV